MDSPPVTSLKCISPFLNHLTHFTIRNQVISPAVLGNRFLRLSRPIVSEKKNKPSSLNIICPVNLFFVFSIYAWCSYMNKKGEMKDHRVVSSFKSLFQMKIYLYFVLDIFLVPIFPYSLWNLCMLYSEHWNHRILLLIGGDAIDTETDFSSAFTFKEMVWWCEIQSSNVYENWGSFGSTLYCLLLFCLQSSETSYPSLYVC